ncbi:PQ-loop repeat-containing protein 3 [Orchesella cincta]|uniref:PQ-loop repeat-containing protein 3 n=1 Tax=Orchesella cincta TaxID=48709 RepID=A0A1D2NHK1_ORCCI|nr:PQ-loop repeat-containing protein 3 [Orchesella cincta]
MTPLIHYIIAFCDITTIGLCVICKIPQILLIYKTKSVEGLSESSLALELLTYVISLSYNAMKEYPLSSYLEDPFLSLQTLAVLLIVYSYNERLTVKRILTLLVVAVAFYILSYGIPSPIILQACLTATLPMKVFSKVLQLKQIWTAKSAGSISLVSWTINIYTCVTRIITTVLVTQDMTILLKHTISVTLNSAVVGLSMYFSRAAKEAKRD